MTVREIILTGDSRLKADSKTIENFENPEFKQLVQDLMETMKDHGSIGLAAPQIGENYRIFVTEPRETEFRSKDQSDELRVFVNPKIIEKSDEENIIFEGCASLPGIFGPVSRPKIITIEAMDQNGKKFRLKCDGILARVIQHEYDHLSGIEFMEKISDYKLLMTTRFYLDKIRSSKEQTKSSTITIKELIQ